MSEPIPTLGSILAKSAEFLQRKSIDNARGDARRLLAHGLNITPMDVMLQMDRPLEPAEIERLRTLVLRRSQNEPLQHILGTVGFRELDIACDARALIPRSETEELVDEVLRRIRTVPNARVHEVGVGTGCISLSLRHERADLRVTGSDISPDALALARWNAKRLGIWLPLVRMNLLSGFLAQPSLDVVVSNPPYIATKELAGLSREVQADPMLALDGGPDGLDLIRPLIEQAAQCLKPGGWILLEHGFDQGPSTRALCAAPIWEHTETIRDLAGHDRFLVAQRAS